MALARTRAVALVGVQGHVVRVEADIGSYGLPGLYLVGLPDAALNEARARVRAAVANSGQNWPQRRITVGLFPAALPKRGSGFDLAVASAVLAADGAVPRGAVDKLVFIGELGLDGRVRPVPGVLPAVLAAAEAGMTEVVVPRVNLAEAALVPGVTAVGVASLSHLLARLRGEPDPADGIGDGDDAGDDDVAARIPTVGDPAGGAGGRLRHLDLSDVLGQAAARRALEICAAGGHHLWLLGPPGSGKTMLAERLPTMLPALDAAAALEVTAIHSVAGTLPPDCPLITEPPFCGPHHTASKAAMVGGGSGLVRPGAVSLAHRGVLFLDEAPEFSRGVLDALRQPLESGEVVIARAAVTARFPARFTLVLAANPCPCARFVGDGGDCTCSSLDRRRYLGRLSGPLLDRIDLKVEMLPVSRAEMLSDRQFVEPSAVVADRVARARQRAAQRLAGTPWRTNAEVPGRELRTRLAPERGAERAAALERGQVSARGLDRILRVAWTVADLADRRRPGAGEVEYAFGLWRGATW
ncbi:MAG: YifB family Mg chelatase-like AAA ATPase [Streptosporangiales bacterium]|nr:YifB family Mg chelatase-like AAA ATPase [Streptosporangiales bacterium]